MSNKEKGRSLKPQCHCDSSSSFTAAILSQMFAKSDPLRIASMLSRLVFDAALTVDLYGGDHDGPCSSPTPPKYCWYVHPRDQLWVRDIMLEGLAQSGLGLEALRIRDLGQTSISELAPSIFRAAAHSKPFTRVTAEIALDVLSVIHAGGLRGLYPDLGGGWLAELCKAKPWIPICWLIHARTPSPVVQDLLTINLAHEFGLIDTRYTVATLHGLFGALDRRSSSDLSLDSAKAIVFAAVDDKGLANETLARIAGGESGLVTPESGLCTGENWEPWCLFAATRPRLSSLVNVLLDTRTITPPQLQMALRAIGIVMVVG